MEAGLRNAAVGRRKEYWQSGRGKKQQNGGCKEVVGWGSLPRGGS